MRVCLFEDRGALDLEPLTLTRPVFELLCGLTSLAAKQCRALLRLGFRLRSLLLLRRLPLSSRSQNASVSEL